MTECRPENCDAARRFVCVTPGCSWPCGPCQSSIDFPRLACVADALESGTHDERGPAFVNRLRGRVVCPNVTAARAMTSRGG